MQANWSLILNVLLLIGVVVAIGRLMKARRQSLNHTAYQPSLGQAAEPKHYDDIIAIRKVNLQPKEEVDELPEFTIKTQSTDGPSITLDEKDIAGAAETRVDIRPIEARSDTRPALDSRPMEARPVTKNDPGQSIMMFLLAKENRQLAGYELLQTVLAAGLRFGEGHLFHRHQQANGQGPVLCSLAAATASGVFDLQNIGAFSVRGLCLFMHTSGNSTIDAERFAIMLETARQLSDGLDTHLLDDMRRPLNDESLARYRRVLNIPSEYELSALA